MLEAFLLSPDKGEERCLFLLKTFENWGREVNGTFTVGVQELNGLVRVGHQTGCYVHSLRANSSAGLGR